MLIISISLHIAGKKPKTRSKPRSNPNGQYPQQPPRQQMGKSTISSQGNLKRESVVAAILPSHMEVNYCTSGFFL